MGRSDVRPELAGDAGRGGAVLFRDRLLIDECLSVSLVAVAKARAMTADHVAYLGKGGWQDWNLVPFALENNYIAVTNNRRHFLSEYAKLDVHNGLVVIVPAVRRAVQQQLFESALAAIADKGDDIVNTVVEILLNGAVHIRRWTKEIMTTGISYA